MAKLSKTDRRVKDLCSKGNLTNAEIGEVLKLCGFEAYADGKGSHSSFINKDAQKIWDDPGTLETLRANGLKDPPPSVLRDERYPPYIINSAGQHMHGGTLDAFKNKAKWCYEAVAAYKEIEAQNPQPHAAGERSFSQNRGGRRDFAR